jgi:hypothetical protein
MARVYIALPQYRAIPLEKELELAKHFGFKNWRAFGIHPMCAKSLAGLRDTPHEYELNLLRNDGVERARCTLFGQWLAEWKRGNKFDYLMTFDEDIEFDPASVVRMLSSGKPIVGGTYTYKTTTNNRMGKSVSKYFENEVPDENGFLKVRWLPGGFVLIKAEVLFAMMERYPELHYERFDTDWDDPDCKIVESYGLWMTMIFTTSEGEKVFGGKNLLLSEDYAFCQRAQDAGFDIWLDTTATLTHWKDTSPYNIGVKPIERDLDGIAGWMSKEELSWLAETSRTMESVVEIGSWKGRSTKVLLENCPGDVYAVDHFEGCPADITGNLAKSQDVYSQFVNNVGAFENLRVLRMSSEEAANTVDGDKFDMVFIDGDHTFSGVKKDIEMWLPKCKKLICGHDYHEVMYIVHALLGNVKTCGTIWYKNLA